MKNIKKSILLLVSVFILCFSTVFANSQRDIKITLDGKQLETDVAPFIKNDRTLVPIKFISESLGYEVKWDEAKRTVAINKEDNNMLLTIDSKTVVVNGENKTTDVAPAIYNNRTYVPVRFVSANFGLDVDWDNATSTVILKTKQNTNFSKEENEYLLKRESYRISIEKEVAELKSYFFENSSKYTEEEVMEKYYNHTKNIEKNIENIKNLDVPSKFKTSHDLLLEALDFTKEMLPQFKEALIDGNSDASTKIIDLITKNSIKMSEAEKALKSESKGIEYTPDKDIDIYNKTLEQKDKTSNLLEDDMLKGLLERI